MTKLLKIIQGVSVFQDVGTNRVHYVADMSVDVDGAKHSYRLDNEIPPALDDIHASAGYPGGSWRNVLVPDSENVTRPYIDEDGFCISKTSYWRPGFSDLDRNKWVDAEAIPYMVLPGSIRQLCKGVALGCKARITRTTDGVAVDGVYADSSGNSIGECSIAAAKHFGSQWNANNGDERQIYQYEFFPGQVPNMLDPVTGKPFRLIPL